MSNKNQAWKGTTGGGNIGQKALLVLLRLVNIRVSYIILAVVVPLYMLFNRNYYRAIKEYFRRTGYHKNTLRNIYKNYFLFGQMMIDRFYLFAKEKNIFSSKITNWDAFTRLLEGESGFVISGAHIGNFEICGYFMKQQVKKLHAVVFGGESAFLQSHRAQALSGNTASLISISPDMSHLFTIKTALDKGDIVSMPCDRLFGSTKAFTVPFLGSPALFPMGGFMLAAQLNVPMISLFVMREKKKKYHIYCMPVEVDRTQYKNSRKTAEALCHKYVAQLEEIVHAYPHQWFNFFDFWNTDVI